MVQPELIVVDDIGLLPVGANEAEALYRLVDAAYEKRSLILTSNLHPARFDTILPRGPGDGRSRQVAPPRPRDRHRGPQPPPRRGARRARGPAAGRGRGRLKPTGRKVPPFASPRQRTDRADPVAASVQCWRPRNWQPMPPASFRAGRFDGPEGIWSSARGRGADVGSLDRDASDSLSHDPNCSAAPTGSASRSARTAWPPAVRARDLRRHYARCPGPNSRPGGADRPRRRRQRGGPLLMSRQGKAARSPALPAGRSRPREPAMAAGQESSAQMP
jgi:hypothetical protein